MNTLSILSENSEKMQEGLYLELMNGLKLDFDKKKEETKLNILVIDRNFPRFILMKKKDILEHLIKSSIDFEDREEILLKIIKMSYHDLVKFCKLRNINYMTINPRWKKQSDNVKHLKEYHAAEWSQAEHIK